MKNNIQVLYDEFPGEDKWCKFSSLANSADIENLITKIPDVEESILRVLCIKFGGRIDLVVQWMTEENRALDGKLPIEVYRSKVGSVVIKTLLMRMH